MINYKAIFFDAAGTLISTSRPVGESYALLARRYGIGVDPGELTRRFRSCFAAAPPLAFPGVPAGRIKQVERQWWKDLVRTIFEPFGSFTRFDDYFAELFEYFSRAEAWSLYPEVQDTLFSLRRRGLNVTIISNFDSRLFGILDGLGISTWVDSVVISSQAGYAKPAREIFLQALDLHQIKAEEAMHVGDSPENDASGACAAGLTGVLLDRNGNGASHSYLRVRTLTEILGVIGAR
ncbi:MAG: HAD-IA family hydrolase [Deltaproteobacteria bacterium]|nr:HAD-IA family hydrolase [Deltaproteobacteria bacterium]